MNDNININDSDIKPELTFRNLCFMYMRQLINFPYIEKDFDAITDYQLLCLVVKYLNKVIDNNNKQNESITNLYNAFLQLQTYMNNSVEELEDAFNTLNDYVRDYFANLDVQDEINNKLDQMLEDGVLEQIIEQFIQSTALWCFDTVEDMKDATNLINGSYVKTIGYYSANDGGGAIYKITDTASLTDYQEELDSGLYATLIINDVINVKQFGAYGDNTHDDTTAIQNAINFAHTKIGVLKINNGVYVISDSLNITKTIKIYGEYETGVTNDNIIYGAEIKQTGTDKAIFNIIGSNYSSSFENLRLAGDGTNNTNGTTIGITSDGILSEFTIKNIHFSYYLKYGIVLTQGSIGLIDSCDFGICNIGILFTRGTKINITNNNFWNNLIDIKVGQMNDSNIMDNWFESNNNDSIGILFQAPTRVLFSSMLNNAFQKVNTCVKFDGTTNITEYITFVMFTIKNNRFAGSSPFIVDMKNEENITNRNTGNRFNVIIEDCIFNNATSGQAIHIDYDALGSDEGWRMINCRAFSGWSGTVTNMFNTGQSNTAVVNSDNGGIKTNGAIQLEQIVNYTLKKNNSIFLDSANNVNIRNNDGQDHVILVNKKGSSANRPATANIGEVYYDTTIYKPLWWSGNAWVDATGNVPQ